MAKRLQGKSAIVVGAGSIGDRDSNGSATAIVFAREGATVVCADKSLAAAQRTATQITDQGGQAYAVQADVRDAAAIRAMVDRCLALTGRVDVLHNNVGIEEFGELTEISEESWDRVHAINLKGPMLTCREVVPHMIRQGGGSIINISSVASHQWSPMPFLSYNTSKAALNHMTLLLAKSCGPVRVNAVAPGLVETPWTKDWSDQHAGVKAMAPLGRSATPEDCVEATLGLLRTKYGSGFHHYIFTSYRKLYHQSQQ
jgi:NAD(P)-dependent dehydrogenase (short-subunit alcohol dehydrogenase family)